MPYPVVRSSLLLALCAACAHAPSERPERANLLADAKHLSGHDVVDSRSGPWLVRRAGPDQASPAALGKARPDGKEATGGDAGGIAGAPRSDPRGRHLGTETKLFAAGTIAPAAPAPEPIAAAPAGIPLRAGTTDDNQALAAFLEFVAAQKAAGTFATCADLDVAEPKAIRVVGADGAPVTSAAVRLVDADKDEVVWRGTTYGDGRVPFYPRMLGERAGRTWLCEVEHDGAVTRTHWNGTGDELVVRLTGRAAADEVALDVVFLIDTTGSMGDEIERIKGSLLATTQKLRGVDREFDLRYGAVLYRDVGDEYVTMAHPFTADIAAFDKALQEIAAGGGGDTPESLNQGLAVAVDDMEWRPAAAKLVFLVADAAPHMDYEGDVAYGDSVRAAVARGIKVHAVAASGLDMTGTIVFRQVAQFTRGKFIFIEYGGDVAKTAEGHGVTGEAKSNNLDDILFEQIRDEIARFGRGA